MSSKKDLIKGILAGKLSKESLDPPIFKMELIDSGEMQCSINGIVVSHEKYIAEMERLNVSPLDSEFEIHFSPE